MFVKALRCLCRKKKFPFSYLRNRNFGNRKEIEILLIFFYDSMFRDNVSKLFKTSRHIRVDIFGNVSFKY